MKAFYFVILFIIFLSLNLSSAAVLKKGKHLNGNKGTCYDNCKNPVYLINRQNGLTLDIWNDPTQDSAGYSHYSWVRFTNLYNTWCIRSDGTIISNQNNLVLCYLGTLKCGASGFCGWQAQMSTHPDGFFPSQQIWAITKEASGFISLKETLTIRNGNYKNQGWLVPAGNDVALKITDANDIAGEWILAPAPKCKNSS